jgi:hypothetical protein
VTPCPAAGDDTAREAIAPAAGVLPYPRCSNAMRLLGPGESQPDAVRLPPVVSWTSLRHAAALGMAAARFGQPPGGTTLP